MITILCSGSRGDIQPYAALGQELMKLGKTVRIACNADFKDFIGSYGIGFYPILAGSKAVADEKTVRMAQSADNPFKMILSFNELKKYGFLMTKDMYDACAGSELIVYHPGCTIGYFAAEQMGIPSVMASPFPMHKTKETMSVILYGRMPSNRITISSSYSMLQGMLWMASKGPVKSFWKETFDTIPPRFGSPFERTDGRHPSVVSCSNYVFPRPKDWDENIHQGGYWFAEEPDAYQPSVELAAFLDAGEKPVYFGFGSVFNPEQKEKLSKIILEALSITGKRGIVSGMGELTGLPGILSVGNVPHSWLFERVAAVCHHGGAGTTAAGFRAGVPGIIVPFSNDQFAWAHRAYHLGAASTPVPVKKLSAQKLAQAIRFALSDEIAENARALAKCIAAENGAADAACVIAGCLEK